MKRYPLTVAAVGAAALAVAPAALGTHGDAVPTGAPAGACPTGVELVWEAFGPSGQPVNDWSITLRGAGLLRSGSVQPAGLRTVEPVALPGLNGTGVLDVFMEVHPTASPPTVTISIPFTCPPLPGPGPHPLAPPHPTGEQTPTPQLEVDCADLRRFYPKAGPAFWVAHGCAAPRREKLTCADLRARGAGKSWLRKLGCVKPRPSRPTRPTPDKPPTRKTCAPGLPCLPPVTGSVR